MHVVIAGGHGKIALILERLLAERGDTVTGLIRNPAQADDLRAAGAQPVVLNLERAGVTGSRHGFPLPGRQATRRNRR